MRTAEKFLGLPPGDLSHLPVVLGKDPASAAVRIELLRDSDSAVRGAAAYCIGILGPPARPAIPILIDLLEDPDPAVRMSVAVGLWYFGPDARAAVPGLQQRLNDDCREVRDWAGAAIQAIDPEAAAKTEKVDP